MNRLPATVTGDSAKANKSPTWTGFGLPGQGKAHRVIASQTKTKPFRDPVQTSWHVKIPKGQVPRLLEGFCPEEHGVQWFVYAEEPDEQGHTVVHFHRSWNGVKVAELEVVIGEGIEEEAKVTSLIWESYGEVTRDLGEQGIKDMIKEICRWVLGTELRRSASRSPSRSRGSSRDRCEGHGSDKANSSKTSNRSNVVGGKLAVPV